MYWDLDGFNPSLDLQSPWSFFFSFFWIVTSAPIMIDGAVIHKFYILVIGQVLYIYKSFSFSFNFALWLAQIAKFTSWKVFLDWPRQGDTFSFGNSNEFYIVFLGEILVCTNIIGLYVSKLLLLSLLLQVFIQVLTSRFHCSLNDSKFLQISRAFLSIPADFTSALFRIVLILPHIYHSSLFSKFF